MGRPVETVLDAARKLSADEKEELLVGLLADLARSSPEIDEAWQTEIERRVLEFDQGKVKTFDSDVVLAEARARLRNRV